MDEKKTPEKVDDLVALLDQFMQNGGGHMNISAAASINNQSNNADKDQTKPTLSVDTNPSNECNVNMACSVPTIHQGIDDDETEPDINHRF